VKLALLTAWLGVYGGFLRPPTSEAHRISLHEGQGKELDAQFVTVK
jgi:hypothetical protein